MRICNPDRLPAGINGGDTAPTPTGFAEIVSDYFPVLHLTSSVAPFEKNTLIELYRCCGVGEASFWKCGSFRSGSNIGSSRSSAGVSGTFAASAPSYGIESSFCKAAMAWSGSPCAPLPGRRSRSAWDHPPRLSRSGSQRSPVRPELMQRPCHQGPYSSARDRQ